MVVLGFPAPLMHLTRSGLDESHTLKLPCEGINFDGEGIFL
jgi:hypothetical protein